MSHISILNEQNQRSLALSNPWHQHKKRYKETDFQVAKDAMATPKRFVHTETPRPRKLKFVPDLVAAIEEEEHDQFIREISGATWKVYRVSPLFNFGSATASPAARRALLDALENFLESQLDARWPEWMVAATAKTSGTHWKVRMEVTPGLRGHREDHEGLKVQVSLPRATQATDKVLFRAFFLSVDAAEPTGYCHATLSTMKLLPLCLARGDAAVANLIFQGFQKRFDCLIYGVSFDDDHLQWMSAMWMGLLAEPEKDQDIVAERNREVERRRQKENRDPEFVRNNTTTQESAIGQPGEHQEDASGSGHVFLRYQVSRALSSGINHVDVEIDELTMRKFWDCFFDDKTTEILKEDVEEFHQLLQQQFLNSFQMKMSQLQLIWIKIPAFHGTRNGQIKISSHDKVKTVLSYLTEICQGSLRTPFPTLSTEENEVIGLGSS